MPMRRSVLLIGGAALLLCAPSRALAKAAAAASEWDPKAAAELKAVEEKLADAFGKQDLETIKSSISEQMWSGWDLDMAGRPAGWTSYKDVIKFFDDMFKMGKQMGMTYKWTTTKVECRAQGNLGTCMQEG